MSRLMIRGRTARRCRPGCRRRPHRSGHLAVATVVVAGVLTGGRVAAQNPDTPPPAVPPSVTLEPDVAFATVHGITLTLDVYRPTRPTGTPSPAVVLVHGGGWEIGTSRDWVDQGELLARQGWVAFAVNYRLTPQLGTGGQAWPTELADVQRAIRWVAANASRYGADPDRLAVLGASAGGQLAALVATVGTDPGRLPPGNGAAPADPPDPNPVVPVDVVATWSAPAELAPLVGPPERPLPACGGNRTCSEFWTGNPGVTNLLGCTPSECPDVYAQASPASALRQPTVPLYIANSTDELVPLEQARALAAAAERAGAVTRLQVIEGDDHAYAYTDLVWNDMMPFLAEHLGVPAPPEISFPSRERGLSPALLTVLVVVGVLAVGFFAGAALRHREERGG
jgi:acetyl esterase/lipase